MAEPVENQAKRTDDAVDVRVDGAFRVVEDQSTIPTMLFGVHATELSPERIADWGVESVRLLHQNPNGVPTMPGVGDRAHLAGLSSVLDCYFDRYQPALILTEPATWRDRLRNLGQSFAAHARGQEGRSVIEFWNEPYLNWSVKPGVNYDGDHFDTSRAVVGGPVHFRGSDDAIPHLIWSRGLMAVDADTGAKHYLAWGYAPKTIVEDGVERAVRAGDEYVWRGQKRMKFVEHWLVVDQSQPSYWAGQFNSRLYREMLEEFARAAKEVNPDVKVVGGFDFHFYQGSWDSFRSCFKPMIDATWQYIDAVDEHHYGEDTRRVAASYELVVGYTLATHGKRLRVFNTEAGGMLDPQRPDTPAATNWNAEQPARAIGAFTYTTRDLLYLLRHMPEKAHARYAHEAHQNGGDEWAFRLLKPLRGRLLWSESQDTNLWSVASLNDAGEVCVVLFNDTPKARETQISIQIPSGTQATEIKQAIVVVDEANPTTLTMRETTQLVDANRETGGTIKLNLTIPARAPLRVVIPTTAIAGEDATRIERVERQRFADRFLSPIEREQGWTSEIALERGLIASAEAARLRVTMTGPAGDMRVKVNGQRVQLSGDPYLAEALIPVESLREVNRVEIESDRATQVDTVSLMIVEERSAR